ncbi:MAG: hypothetical protein PWQ35_413 [Patescibacteria group bacterium]|nr:hypothetical protein [Patescibacteria group bacterium]
MKVFTIESGTVKEWAEIEEIKIKDGGFSYYAIVVGEYGQGRRFSALPVDPRLKVKRNGKDAIIQADVGKTKKGGIKLVPEVTSDEEECIVVFRTKIGFRGSNEHTGDRLPTGKNDYVFHPFPGTIIAEGIIARGKMGEGGRGQQIIAIMPKNVVFRTGYSGFLYGDYCEHYYLFNGKKIIAVTWQDRIDSDIF